MAATYIITKSDLSPLGTIGATQINDTLTSLTLTGKSAPQYGEIQQNNLVHLLEHFANSIAPENPITGQIWYDPSLQQLKVYDTNQWLTFFGTDLPDLVVDALGYVPLKACPAPYVPNLGDPPELKLTQAVSATYVPTLPLHVVNKAYVDSYASGLKVRGSVKRASMTVVTDYGDPNFDGAPLNDFDRVLVAAPGSPPGSGAVENGIWEWNSGVLARPSNFTGTVPAGAAVYVDEGTYANTQWVMEDLSIVGVDKQVWSKFGPYIYDVGTGLTASGTNPILFNVNANLPHVTGLGNVTLGTWNASTISAARGGTGLASYTNGSILIATALTASDPLTYPLQALPIGTATQVLTSNGTMPTWAAIPTPLNINTNATTGADVTDFYPIIVGGPTGTQILKTDSNFKFNPASNVLFADGFQGSAFVGGTFSGTGLGLTALNATSLTTGTVPAARLSGVYTIGVTGNVTGNLTGNATTATTAGSTQIFMSTSHAGTYWLVNNWDGTYWNITSNHGAPVRVGYADTANTANSATNATNAMNATYSQTAYVAASAVNTNYPIVFANTINAYSALYADSGAGSLRYNPATDTLTNPIIVTDTPSLGDNSTRVPTTAWVTSKLGGGGYSESFYALQSDPSGWDTVNTFAIAFGAYVSLGVSLPAGTYSVLIDGLAAQGALDSESEDWTDGNIRRRINGVTVTDIATSSATDAQGVQSPIAGPAIPVSRLTDEGTAVILAKDTFTIASTSTIEYGLYVRSGAANAGNRAQLYRMIWKFHVSKMS